MSAVLEKVETAKPETSGGLPIYKLTVEVYEKMIEHGIFDEDDRVELLDGVIVEMSPKKTKHAIINDLIAEFLIVNFAKKAIVRNQNPIVLDNFSEPEPDVVLASPPRSKYYNTHPTPADILLVVEVSDTTLSKDRRKAFYYARAGIAQYLLFNLITNEVEDYREPGGDGYRFKKTYTIKDSFSLVAFPETTIKVAELFPPE